MCEYLPFPAPTGQCVVLALEVAALKMMFPGLDLETEGPGEKFVGEAGESSMSPKGEDLALWTLFVGEWARVVAMTGPWRGSCSLPSSSLWREVRAEG